MSNINEKCSGCLRLLDQSSGCLLKNKPELIEKCPCCSCLIKMVCKTMCKERSRLYTDLSNRKKEYLLFMRDAETYQQFMNRTMWKEKGWKYNEPSNQRV